MQNERDTERRCERGICDIIVSGSDTTTCDDEVECCAQAARGLDDSVGIVRDCLDTLECLAEGLAYA